ncbi:hypothetical protein BDQ17DRAFT_1357547 [Cyathus striatus]|nr:hypothetical protein BDQ17DRAFT_1357547 [Cyathus striatus]
MSLVFAEVIEAGTYIIGNGDDHRLALTTEGNRNEAGPVWVDNAVFLWDITPISGTDLYTIKVAGSNDQYLTIDEAGDVGVGATEIKYQIVFLGLAHYKIVNSENENVLDSVGGFKKYVTAAPNNEETSQEWILKIANVASGAYSAIDADFFIQDNLNSDAASVGPVFPRFGLEDDSPDRWSKFWSQIATLNEKDAGVAQYKVIFLARAVQATHEHAIDLYGFQQWSEVWGRKEGDGDLSWVDPDVTQTGFITALQVRQIWEQELAAGLGLPQISYSSPLTRALVTNTLTFGPEFAQDPPAVNTTETPEKRGTKTYISSEQDPVWSAEKHESPDDVEARVLRVLDRAFADEGAFVSITGHSGFVQSFMKVVGRQDYLMRLGGVVPIVIKRKL